MAVRLRSSPAELWTPVLRAYAFTYLSTSSLLLIRLVPALLSRKRDVQTTATKAYSGLRQAARFDGFPSQAAILVAASTLGPRLLSILWARLSRHASSIHQRLSIRFFTVFCAALAIFRILNGSDTSGPLHSTESTAAYLEAITAPTSSPVAAEAKGRNVRPFLERTFSAGKLPVRVGDTLFVTCFAALNATIVAASAVVDGIARRRAQLSPAAKVLRDSFWSRALRDSPSPSLFILSSAVIMWSWFFTPGRLPREYGAWIGAAAQVDSRLVDVLRKCRSGTLEYGRDTGAVCHLPEIAQELGYPRELGDQTKVYPFPCELYHSGTGKSCEWHAMSRFARGWMFAIRIYLPLNLVVLLRKRPTARALRLALQSAARSASFLGAFIAFFYYGVCLGRTRIGPIFVGTSARACQTLDGGVCVGTASFLCGWSILIERKERREEMALFVGPRALRALLPQHYDSKYLWREQIAFALSAATILTAADSRPYSIRGVFGRLVRNIYR